MLHAQAGQRAYVGLVCMDRNSAEYYTKSLDDNLRDTAAFIQHTRSKPLLRCMAATFGSAFKYRFANLNISRSLHVSYNPYGHDSMTECDYAAFQEGGP